ncbi:helix-turn-helix domain-containing protein [Aquisalimonas asiatica]|uniref:Cro/C1-type HTH DNA-binding domain-containing protein n=1 Tax=Aquisalimonas asiatica TaxID=406100 RepID=A0A1H8Q2L9_9GAMM|nr:helix-turn-helix domain-containing protein [Aquisalimonas asiatica]SEO48174.1 Cro/C1-type HTH DNA-binding domain-containing protein [Aquisalimonas asiatica]
MSPTPQTSLLINTLKRALKTHGVTYAHVADALDLSEASVKRLFSEESFSLQRLETVSNLAGLSLTELSQMVEDGAGEIRQLSAAQEQALADEPRLLLVFYLLLNRYTLADIITDYDLEELDCIRLMTRLDRMGLIELQPGNRARLLTSRFLTWRENGPIRAFFDQHVRGEFFDSAFDTPPESLQFVSGMLSQASLRVMERKLNTLAKEFNELARLDSGLPLDERHGCSVMLAQRVWAFSMFSRYARKQG